jgi:hypothetical protein
MRRVLSATWKEDGPQRRSVPFKDGDSGARQAQVCEQRLVEEGTISSLLCASYCSIYVAWQLRAPMPCSFLGAVDRGAKTGPAANAMSGATRVCAR